MCKLGGKKGIKLQLQYELKSTMLQNIQKEEEVGMESRKGQADGKGPSARGQPVCKGRWPLEHLSFSCLS